MVNKARIGRKSQKQGARAERFVIRKLKQYGWTVISTKASKSKIDILAHHTKKDLWWGIQVKSSKKNTSFPIKDLARICNQLYFEPVFAFVKIGKKRTVTFCKWKNGTLYHVYEDGKYTHVLGESKTHECLVFEPKIGTLS